jgi:S-disulfanyl-L-cysteine oxidoreductase SoxD
VLCRTLVRLGVLLAACALALAYAACARTSSAAQLGRTPTADEIAAWNIDVSPNGDGLPAGSGTAGAGESLYAMKCVACHGVAGRSNLEGGIGLLRGPNPIRSVGSYWPYATTLFDYVRRAMPADKPQSLTADEVYALSAYILWMNGIVSKDQTLDRASLPRISMPNRNGFTERDPRPDVP